MEVTSTLMIKGTMDFAEKMLKEAGLDWLIEETSKGVLLLPTSSYWMTPEEADLRTNNADDGDSCVWSTKYKNVYSPDELIDQYQTLGKKLMDFGYDTTDFVGEFYLEPSYHESGENVHWKLKLSPLEVAVTRMYFVCLVDPEEEQ